jgi:hypothetical protein
MALTTVAELRSTLGVGTLYPDATLQEVCDAADAVLLPMLWANKYYASGHSNQGTVGTLYFNEEVTKIFYVGQTVNITGAGSHFNGNKTITGVGTDTITITTDHVTDTPYHPFQPFATVAASSYQSIFGKQDKFHLLVVLHQILRLLRIEWVTLYWLAFVA